MESVALTKDANTKKDFSPFKKPRSIHNALNELKRKHDSLQKVLSNIRSNGSRPSDGDIATELNGTSAADSNSVLLELQKTHGNHYVQRIVGIQRKLRVSEPGDIYEQEADWVAEQVMRMPEPKVQRECPSDKNCPIEDEKKKKKGLVQLKTDHSDGGEISAPDNLLSNLGSGQHLDSETRVFMEPRFGFDFDQVRIHTDSKANESAESVNAQAYTVGQDIIFGSEQYQPHTNEGKKVLAHELAHVVQQKNTSSRTYKFRTERTENDLKTDYIPQSRMFVGLKAHISTKNSPQLLMRSLIASGSSHISDTKRSIIPEPIRKKDGSCDCRLDICWRPIQAYWGIIGALGYKHGFINIIDSKCENHNLFVDPSQHKAGKESHSHAVDSPSWDTSGKCYKLNPPWINCSQIDKLPVATARYEAMDIAYSPRNGPNSNSFLEWILYDVGIDISNLPSGLVAWDYYKKNSSKRSSPPRVKRS